MNRDNTRGPCHRYFVALLPPGSIQDEVTAIKTDICQRFHSCAALKLPPHITLQPPFLYPVDQEHILTRVLSDCASKMPDLTIRLDGFGVFSPMVNGGK